MEINSHRPPGRPQGGGKGGQDPTSDHGLKKGAEANVEGDEYWTDWVKAHHKQEAWGNDTD